MSLESFERHHRSVYRFLYRMTGSREAAEDLTQETFLRALRHGRGGESDPGRAWLLTVARNLALNRRRDRARAPVEVAPGDTRGPGADQDTRVLLHEALRALSERDREIFLLREIGGLDLEEIARACDTTRDAVRSRLHRTRVALRSALTR